MKMILKYELFNTKTQKTEVVRNNQATEVEAQAYLKRNCFKHIEGDCYEVKSGHHIKKVTLIWEGYK